VLLIQTESVTEREDVIASEVNEVMRKTSAAIFPDFNFDTAIVRRALHGLST